MPPVPHSNEMGTISFSYLRREPVASWLETRVEGQIPRNLSRTRSYWWTNDPGRRRHRLRRRDIERVCNRVAFIAKLSDRSYIYARIRMSSKDGQTVSRDGWIAVDVGDKCPRKVSRDEWVIYRKPSPGGWARFDLFLPEETNRTFGQAEGLQFSELLGFRLRGSLSVSPISLFWAESKNTLSEAGNIGVVPAQRIMV